MKQRSRRFIWQGGRPTAANYERRHLLLIQPDAPFPRHERNLRLPVVGRIKYDLVFFLSHHSLLVHRGRDPFTSVRHLLVV